MSAATTRSPTKRDRAAPPRSLARRALRVYRTEARQEFLKLVRIPIFAASTIALPLMFYVLFGIAFAGEQARGVGVATYMLVTYGAFGVIGAALFFYGALIGVGMVIWGTLLQQRVPLEMLGRIASLDFLVSISLMPISIALAGMLSTVLPYGIMFALAGLTPPILAVVLIAAARLRRDELAHPLQQAEHVTAEHAD